MGNISSTMIAFDPGELSIVEVAGNRGLKGATKIFNLADLPCPPQSVMEANRYSPAPSYPWRPYLALPKKLLSLDPLWSTCTPPAFFTGLDPPRTLERASVMVDPGQPIPNVPQQTDPPEKPPSCQGCDRPGELQQVPMSQHQLPPHCRRHHLISSPIQHRRLAWIRHYLSQYLCPGLV